MPKIYKKLSNKRRAIKEKYNLNVKKRLQIEELNSFQNLLYFLICITPQNYRIQKKHDKLAI
jgi:hypothetical protein